MGQGGILNFLMPREDNDGAGRAVKPHICDARETKKSFQAVGQNENQKEKEQ